MKLIAQRKLWLALGLFFASAAHADQCEIVTRQQASTARRLLLPGQSWIVRLCEPCGERLTPNRRPELVLTATSSLQSANAHRVVVNGTSIDLAYVFVHIGNGHFVNLARLSRCPASDVSPRIFVPNWSPGRQR